MKLITGFYNMDEILKLFQCFLGCERERFIIELVKETEIGILKVLIYLPQKKIMMMQKHWLGSVC